MKHGIYTILDRIAGINAIVQMPSDQVALRYFKTAFKNPQAGFDKNAADYIGVRLGYLDTETGILEQEYAELIDCYDYLANEKKEKDNGEN